jgi:hypothetical protein
MFTNLALSRDVFMLDILEFMGREYMHLAFVLEPYYLGLSPTTITYCEECFERQHSSRCIRCWEDFFWMSGTFRVILTS